jgi:hypothetical protein
MPMYPGIGRCADSYELFGTDEAIRPHNERAQLVELLLGVSPRAR